MALNVIEAIQPPVQGNQLADDFTIFYRDKQPIIVQPLLQGPSNIVSDQIDEIQIAHNVCSLTKIVLSTLNRNDSRETIKQY